MLAVCVMAVSLVCTLAVTAANLRLTYVTDSDGARFHIRGHQKRALPAQGVQHA